MKAILIRLSNLWVKLIFYALKVLEVRLQEEQQLKQLLGVR
jgi:hypothetical protein